MEKAKIEEIVRQAVQDELERRTPHTCHSCDWFRTDVKPPSMRLCRNPAKVELDERGFCKLWCMAKDIHLRVRGNFAI